MTQLFLCQGAFHEFVERQLNDLVCNDILLWTPSFLNDFETCIVLLTSDKFVSSLSQLFPYQIVAVSHVKDDK